MTNCDEAMFISVEGCFRRVVTHVPRTITFARVSPEVRHEEATFLNDVLLKQDPVSQHRIEKLG